MHLKSFKYFTVGLFTLPVLLAVLYCGKWSYDRLSIAEQLYQYMVGAPQKGQPSRATEIDALYTHPMLDAATLKALVQADVDAALAKEKEKAKK